MPSACSTFLHAPLRSSSSSCHLRPPPSYFHQRLPSPHRPLSLVLRQQLHAVPPDTQILVASIQDLRDLFRALFFPGISILTFGLPLLLVGLLFNGNKATTTTKSSTQASSIPFQAPQLNTILFAKLLASILIDLIGDGSLLIPGAGDASDFLWAPLSAVLVRLLYGNNVLAAVAFLEEILPFTDVIPTATIAFVLEVFFRKAEEEDFLKKQQQQQNGKGGGEAGVRRRSSSSNNNIIDVKATTVMDDETKRLK